MPHQDSRPPRPACLRSTRFVASSIYLAAVADPQHQDHKLVVLDVIDDPVVANANAELAVAAAQLQTSGRAWIFCELFNRNLQACSNLRMKRAKGFAAPRAMLIRYVTSARNQSPSSSIRSSKGIRDSSRASAAARMSAWSSSAFTARS